MKKAVVWFLAGIFMCVAAGVFADDITIAVMPKGLDNAVFEPTKTAAEAEAKAEGVNLLWVGPAETDTQGQIAVVKQMIAKKVNGIALSANDATALNDVIAEAVAAGIPVTTWDSDAKDSKRLYYIGTDNYKGGFKCGEEMKALIGANKKVVALSGAPNAANLNDRITGFKDAVKDSHIEIVDVLYCNDSVDESVAQIESYLKNNPAIDGFYFAGGWPLFGKVETMTNLKAFTGGVVCFDYFTPAKAFIEQGMIDVCIGQNFSNMGTLSVKYLVDVIKNKTVYPQINDSGLFRVDKNNVAER